MKIAAEYGNLCLVVEDGVTPDSDPMSAKARVYNKDTGTMGDERPIAVHLKFGDWTPVVPFRDYQSFKSKTATEAFFFHR